MAKRKTPKVKDLRPETITKEELQKLQDVVKSVNEAQMQLGVIETQKHSLLHDVFNAQQMIDVIRKQLISTYGDHEFNILDGSIKYNEDGNDKTDTKDNGR